MYSTLFGISHYVSSLLTMSPATVGVCELLQNQGTYDIGASTSVGPDLPRHQQGSVLLQPKEW